MGLDMYAYKTKENIPPVNFKEPEDAGLLWDKFGASVTFYAGAGFAAMTLLGLLLPQLRRHN